MGKQREKNIKQVIFPKNFPRETGKKYVIFPFPQHFQNVTNCKLGKGKKHDGHFFFPREKSREKNTIYI